MVKTIRGKIFLREIVGGYIPGCSWQDRLARVRCKAFFIELLQPIPPGCLPSSSA